MRSRSASPSRIEVTIEGHVGYYCAGMNQAASVTIHGHAGQGLAENIMSGVVRVTGNASQAAGASGHGGLVVIEGDASSRCGISMKGVDIVVRGSVGHMSAFMAQAGHLVVCGDAGPDLGDSIYEAVLYVRGKVASLGSDCIEQPMTEADRATLEDLLERAGFELDAGRLPPLRLGAPALQFPHRPRRQLLGQDRRGATGWSAPGMTRGPPPPGCRARRARPGRFAVDLPVALSPSCQGGFSAGFVAARSP